MKNVKTTRGARPKGCAPPVRPATRLKAERVQSALRKMPGWKLTRRGAAISRVFRFRSSAPPLLFAALVGGLADEEGLHPVLTVRNRQVTCRVSASEAGGVTMRDLGLARRISLLE